MAKILVVDDDADVRALLLDLLQMEGYDVQVAGNGAEALESIGRDRPDCVLLDVMMPGMSGHAVLETIRREHSGSPLRVVMLTAAAEDEQARRAWNAGADGFLAKPFETEYLLQCLDRIAC
jgi:CheY-like chemotaxis protein